MPWTTIGLGNAVDDHCQQNRSKNVFKIFGARSKEALALPSIMAGINQTTMMALSMVVIASMIGARGLGEDVLVGIQTLNVGRGLEAGLLVAMFQAATQINEQTLSFLPRLLVMLITLIVAGPWLVQTFMEYILQLYGSIPQLIG